MRYNWKDLFAFTSGERNGIIVLLILLCFPLLVFLWPKETPPVINVTFVEVPEVINYNSQNTITNHTHKANAKDSSYKTSPRTVRLSHGKTQAQKKFKPFGFNPNEIQTKFWEEIGMSQKQRKSIKNYINKGGSFKIKSDVKKLYVVSDSLYTLIKGYIQLPDSFPRVEQSGTSDRFKYSKYLTTEYLDLVVELNTCDTNDLKDLKGIASYSAKRIIRYREQLGGFVDCEQLFEVKGVRKETIVDLMPKFRVDTTYVRQFQLNKATAGEMVKHPYFTWHMAKEIEDQRRFGKKYKKVSDLLKYGLLDEQLYIKIVPYLKL